MDDLRKVAMEWMHASGQWNLTASGILTYNRRGDRQVPRAVWVVRGGGAPRAVCPARRESAIGR